MEIGEVISELRRRTKITQVDLAIKIGITQGSLSNIESGKKKPHRSTVKRLCDALEIPVLFFDILSAAAIDIPEKSKSLHQELKKIIFDRF